MHHKSTSAAWKNVWFGVEVAPSAAIFGEQSGSKTVGDAFFNKMVRSVGGRPRGFYKDLAYYVLNLPWIHGGIVLAMLYFGIIFLFALVFHCVCQETEDLLDGFNLSYQAFSTIGFGIVYSRERCGNYTTVVESIVSMVILPTIAGIIFTKFSSPKVKVAFSNVCCIQPNYKPNTPALIVRVANASSSQDLDTDVIMDASFSMELFVVDSTTKPGVLRRHKLALRQAQFIFFRLALELVHVIDINSPLHGLTFDANCMLHVTISGVDSNRHATIVNQMTYTHNRVCDGYRFRQMLDRDDNGLILEFDYLSSTIPVTMDDYAAAVTPLSLEEQSLPLDAPPSWSVGETRSFRNAPFVESGFDGFLFKHSSNRSIMSNVLSEGSYANVDDTLRRANNYVQAKHVPHVYQYTYYHILNAKWRYIVGGIVLMAGVFTILFALLHWIHFDYGLAIMPDMLPPRNTAFELCVYLSLHTFSTIGYGNIGPSVGDRYHNALVAIEAMIGLTVAAVLTGIFWSKFALPQAHIQFSSKISITTLCGQRCLVFRAINTRSVGDIQLCHFKLGAFFTDRNGARRMHDLPLIQANWPTINIPVTLVHVIDSSSPLVKYSVVDDLSSMSMLALFSGFDTTFCETVYARNFYTSYDYDRNFDDAVTLTSSHLLLDWKKVDIATRS